MRRKYCTGKGLASSGRSGEETTPMNATELLMVRHGESEANVGLSTDPDCCLTPRGLQQARDLAPRLARLDLTGFVAVASPYRRAVQTAEVLAAATAYQLHSLQCKGG
jgi:broad specificity phosphatase PhoE